MLLLRCQSWLKPIIVLLYFAVAVAPNLLSDRRATFSPRTLCTVFHRPLIKAWNDITEGGSHAPSRKKCLDHVAQGGGGGTASYLPANGS